MDPGSASDTALAEAQGANSKPEGGAGAGGHTEQQQDPARVSSTPLELLSSYLLWTMCM